MRLHDLTAAEVKFYQSLEKKKFRKEHGVFVCEGKRAVLDALQSNADIKAIFISESLKKNEDLIEIAKNKALEKKVRLVTERSLQKASHLTTSQGVLAVIKIPKEPPQAHITSSNGVYLDKISNPGNLGSIIRTAAWLGIKNVFLSPESTDPFSPKSVQGGMGGHFSVNIYTDFSVAKLVESKVTLIASTMDGKPIGEIGKVSSPWVLILGSEAFGLDESIVKSAHLSASVPKFGNGESLNVSVACGIILSHLVFNKS